MLILNITLETYAGGIEIANALSNNSQLSSLSVRNNYLHEDAGSAFAAALLRNTTLRKLDVELNQFTHIVFRDINVAVQGNKKEYEATEVDRLWDELDRMRLQELTLFETEEEVADSVCQADEAEALCVELEKRIAYRTDQLQKMKWDSSTVDQHDQKVREDLHEKVVWIQDDIQKEEREAKNRLKQLGEEVDIDMQRHKEARKEVENMEKEIMKLRRQRQGQEQEIMMELRREQEVLEDTTREAKNVDMMIETFMSRLPANAVAMIKDRWGKDMKLQATKTKWAAEADAAGNESLQRPGQNRPIYSDGKAHLKKNRDAKPPPRPPSGRSGAGSRSSGSSMFD